MIHNAGHVAAPHRGIDLGPRFEFAHMVVSVRDARPSCRFHELPWEPSRIRCLSITPSRHATRIRVASVVGKTSIPRCEHPPVDMLRPPKLFKTINPSPGSTGMETRSSSRVRTAGEVALAARSTWLASALDAPAWMANQPATPAPARPATEPNDRRRAVLTWCVMAGQRVFVSGVGGELGTQIASLLENEPWVGSLAGIDANPPRARFKRMEFHRIHPHEHDRIVSTVMDFDPHVLVHAAVWEPNSRAAPKLAAELTDSAATSILGAAAECASLEHVVVRSAISVYGKDSLTRPDEDAPLRPTSGWGHTAAEIERIAASVGTRIGVGVGIVRLAPVLGPHVPSPLGRLLRLSAVPFNVFGDPSFAVIRQNDAAQAMVAAARERLAQPVNVVASGSVTASQAAHRGRRLAIPTFGPQWIIARRVAALAGAPIPDQVAETLIHGRLADNGRMRELLGVVPQQTTPEVIDSLYGWPSIIRRPARKQVA